MVAHIIAIGLLQWLAAYMIARDGQSWSLRLTATGILFSTFLLSAELLWGPQNNAFYAVPALCWIGAFVHMIPQHTNRYVIASRVWMVIVVPLFMLVLLNVWFTLTIMLLLAVCLAVVPQHVDGASSTAWRRFVLVSGLFFALSTSAILFDVQSIPRDWLLVVFAVDLVLVGCAVIWWDVFAVGDTIRTHIFGSFVTNAAAVGVLVAIVWVAASIDGGMTAGYRAALVCVMTYGVFSQTFATNIYRFIDRLTMSRTNILPEQRELLRDTADVLTRISTRDVLLIEEEEFVRLTRRAISCLGDLPKLATSPLMNLPAVMHVPTHTPLDRVSTLRALLVDSIGRLKPSNEKDFDTTDEWRHYNALFFPYVCGIKPYGRRYGNEVREESVRRAYEWFQTAVPERTLRNWQQAAARLVAIDVRSQR